MTAAALVRQAELIGCAEQVLLPTVGADAFPSALKLFALIAYPESRQKRKKYAHDLKKWIYRECMNYLEPARRMPHSNRTGILRNGAARLEHRFNAAGVLIQLVTSDAYKSFLPANRRLAENGQFLDSISGVCAFFRSDRKRRSGTGAQEIEPRCDMVNRINRTWQQSKPILHLALVITDLILESSIDEDHPIVWFHAVSSLLPGILTKAEETRLDLASDPSLRIALGETIQVLPT